MGGVDGSLARARAFQRDTVGLLAEELTPIPEGWLARNRSLPLAWGLNHVCVTRPIQFADALALVEDHLGDLPYRQLVVEHAASGRRLEGEFRDEGWEVDREVTMVLAGNPNRDVDTSAVIEAGEEEAVALMGRWMREDDELKLTAEGHRQALESNRLTWRA